MKTSYYILKYDIGNWSGTNCRNYAHKTVNFVDTFIGACINVIERLWEIAKSTFRHQNSVLNYIYKTVMYGNLCGGKAKDSKTQQLIGLQRNLSLIRIVLGIGVN